MSLILEFQSTDQGGNGISAECHHGIITKAVGGIYYVDALSGFEKDGRGVPDGTTFKCAARGLFRKNEISPSAGDNVIVECQENHEPLISKILERRNYLVRPPLANLDGIVFVISCADPAPNRFVLDKLIAIADSKQIEPMIAFTKPDLQQAEELAGIYRSIGIRVCMVNNLTGEGAEPVREFINGRVTAFIGNSGVGKSSILNALEPNFGLATGEISEKLGRGRHTTRHVELFPVAGGLIADTPGFSAFDNEKGGEPLDKDTLDRSFREFRPYLGQCRFIGCAHIKEKGCAVLAAVKAGDIPKSRHRSYVRLYELAKENKPWEK